MKAATQPHEFIDVQALRVGMFVHLDGGWMSHPFPLSQFRIASVEQIVTIHGLGLKQVRWDPQQSTHAAANDDAAGAAEAVPPIETADVAEAVGRAAPTETGPAEARPAAPTPRNALARQIESLRVCERQFAEAGRDLKLATELVTGKPREARAQAEALSSALVHKMIGAQDLCVRLLSDHAGDKASMHALNVTIISLLMGRSFGLPETDMQDLGVGAMLHDIGKAELPERLRHVDDRFSPSELAFYREHVDHGLTHGRRMGLSAGAMQVIGQHHEHADGSGFPHGLPTERLSAPTRIVALVNRYDNLCNPKLSAHALTPHEAIALMFAQDRARVDTSILGAFIKMMGVYPPGSTVQLTDDRYALVVSVNASRPLKPNVIVHDEAVPRDEALVVSLEAQPGVGIRRSVKPTQLPAAALEYLSPRHRVAYYFEPARDAEAPA
jgi:putative nucleotidyltransferase with HDIG domain